MPASILATKLYVPPFRTGQVSRSRLVEQLNAGISRKMALLSAPAGYGKTTLVSEWVHQLHPDYGVSDGCSTGIAWLSIDEGDNDPQGFLAHCIAALRGIDDAVGNESLGMVQTPKPEPIEVIMASLINELARIATRMLLVLDDYHLIDSSEIDGIISYLLAHQPKSLHIVISTRTDPHLPLARLRAADELTEIRARDLRFSLSEISDFLNDMMGLDLSEADIVTLEARTEGWIAGLQLAALSLRGRESTVSVIEASTRSQRYVMDYLFEEVLSRQPVKFQEFLMSTSVLTRLCPSLCSAVSGATDSGEIIEALDRGNLFVISLDGDGYWYRYHHLFAELLLNRLERTHPEQQMQLHRRAATWWEENGFVDQAIEHALRCEDSDWAATMLEAHGEELWHRGEGMVIWHWLKALPVESSNSRPMLCIMRGYLLYGAGETVEADRFFALAENLIASGQPKNDGKMKALAARLATVRALMNSFWGDARATMRYVGQARDALSDRELIWHSHVALSIAEIHAFQCDTAASEDACLRAMEASENAGSAYFTMVAGQRLVGTLLEQGRLPEAQELCREQLRIAAEHDLTRVPVAGSWFLSLGEILNQRGGGDDALADAVKGMALDRRNNYLPVRRSWSYFAFMRVLLSRSDFAGIQGIIQEMRTLAGEFNVPDWVASQAEMWQARLYLAQGRVDPAARWMEKRNLPTADLPDDLTLFHFQEYVVAARVLIAQERLGEAVALLTRLHAFAGKNGLVTRDLELLSLSALALQAEGKTEQAVDTIASALSIAEPGGFIRVFTGEGPQMARLLYEAASRGIASNYVRKLLAAFPPAESKEAEQAEVGNSELFEPLSERELDVLRLIAQGLSNQEIGERLFISLHTVKSHARNLFAKLDAPSRTAAVNKARDLGLFPPL